MSARKVLLYFAWSRPLEAGAPLQAIDDRFPAIFELARLFYPKFEALRGAGGVDQGILGFLDHVQKPNFAGFAQQAARQNACEVVQVERGSDDGLVRLLDEGLTSAVDTIVVISFDSLRTRQVSHETEVEAVRHFLGHEGNLIAVCPHHDIGDVVGLAEEPRAARQLAEHVHHGDKAIPPRQGFGGFARSLLAALDVPVINRFGLRPALRPDGSTEPIEAEASLDRLGLLHEVSTFNAHAHLPQLGRIGAARERMDVLARQPLDLQAPPHPFLQEGHESLDALLQSRPGTFAGTLLASDSTVWSSTAGGLDSLSRFWANVLSRQPA